MNCEGNVLCLIGKIKDPLEDMNFRLLIVFKCTSYTGARVKVVTLGFNQRNVIAEGV